VRLIISGIQLISGIPGSISFLVCGKLEDFTGSSNSITGFCSIPQDDSETDASCLGAAKGNSKMDARLQLAIKKKAGTKKAPVGVCHVPTVPCVSYLSSCRLEMDGGTHGEMHKMFYEKCGPGVSGAAAA
jgi:hypothetical protein